MTSSIRKTGLATFIGLALAASVPAAAQPATQSAAEAAMFAFDIPAQPLSSALVAYSQQSGIPVVAPMELLDGKRSQPVQGTLDANQALTLLLAGSGLRPVHGANGGLALVKEEADPRTLQTVVVTASKRAEQVSDVAGAVSAVTSEELDRLSANKLEDYAAFVPGLSLMPYNRGLQVVVIRGIAPQMSSSTTAIYIDDVPVGSASNATDGNYAVADLDPGDLARVEVLKGPQGTLYGASSLGGLLKYVTRDPDPTRSAFRVSAGVHGVKGGETGHELRASANLPLVDERLALRIGGHRRKDAGFLREVSRGLRDVNGGTSEGLRASLLFEPSEQWRIRLNAMSNDMEYGADNNVDIDPATGQPTHGDLSRRNWVLNAGSRIGFDLYALTVERYLDGGGTLTSATGYTDQQSILKTDASLTFFKEALGLEEEQGVLGDITADTDKFTQEVRWTSPAGERFEWMLGGFYQREKGAYFARYAALEADQTPVDLPVIHNNSNTNELREYAAFANATYYFTPSVDMTLGYRWSAIDQKDVARVRGLFTDPANPDVYLARPGSSEEKVAAYLASLRWRPSENLMVYGRAASGYRPGGSRARPVGAPDDFRTMYDSDSVWNYEIGLKSLAFGGRLATELTAFWIDWEDIQQAVIVNTFFTTGNGGKARSRGLEVAARALVGDHLTLTASAAYTDAEFLEDNIANGILAGQRIPEVPTWAGAIGAEYAIPLGGGWNGFVGGDYRHRGEIWTVDRYRIEGYEIAGLHAGMERGGLRFNLYVKNLTDKRAYSGAMAPVGTVPFPMVVLQPRTVGFNVTVEF